MIVFLHISSRGFPEIGKPLLVVGCGFAGSGLCFGDGSDVDELAAVLAFGEGYDAVDECVDGVVLAHAYVEAGVVNSAALTFDDIAGFGKLTAEEFHTETFAF